MTTAVLVLAAVAVPSALIGLSMVLRFRARVALIDAVRKAAESGQLLSADAIDALRDAPGRLTRRARDLRRASVLLSTALGLVLLGVAVFAALAYTNLDGAEVVGVFIAGLGAIPGCIGLTFLGFGLIDRSGPE